jgi:hypothetical protein
MTAANNMASKALLVVAPSRLPLIHSRGALKHARTRRIQFIGELIFISQFLLVVLTFYVRCRKPKPTHESGRKKPRVKTRGVSLNPSACEPIEWCPTPSFFAPEDEIRIRKGMEKTGGNSAVLKNRDRR